VLFRSCPVIASISGVDAALIVVEPTLSGIHDLKRVLDLLKHFNVRPYVCINMYDINMGNTGKIEAFCKDNHLEFVGRIPFDSKITDAMVNGKTILEYKPQSAVSQEITNLWNKMDEFLGEGNNDT
jgi:MinD superfamily P-loop ATPase